MKDRRKNRSIKNKGGEIGMKRNENGITLIALIITIIILVILAAVSIRAVTNMKIVDYAVNGAENYAKAGKTENKTLDETVSFIDEAVEKVNKAANGTDYSAEILAQTNGEIVGDVWNQTLTLSDGTKALPLGPSFTDNEIYYLCDGKIYKVSFNQDNGMVTGASETSKSVSGLGYNNATGKLTTVNGEYTPASTAPDGYWLYNINGWDYKYNSSGVFLSMNVTTGVDE